MKIYLTSILILITGLLQAQNLQVVRGTVKDHDTQMPLIGASIVIKNTTPAKGSVTDPEGNFRIEKVPAGRISLLITYLGYKEQVLNDVELNTGKELILNIVLEESVTHLNEVVINAKQKNESINDMAVVSSRQFTLEESGRYAGSRNDVSRMATNFAGVTNGDDSRNDIVIRGNSPNGLLWRLNGLDIPDPNHFSGMGSNGGPVSMLNYNVLANSDFLTSAFPAEYGNALSGVFDINMRNGNDQKRENMFQFGALGTELMTEGPISKSKGGSYLANYRFSTTSILTAMGIDFGYEGKADYQDLTFNVQLPEKNGNHWEVFGLWGKSIYKVLAEDKEEESFDVSFVSNADNYYITSLRTIGVGYFHRINDNTYIKTTLGLTGETEKGKVDSVSTENLEKIPYFESDNIYNTLSLSSYIKHRLNAKNKLIAGFQLKEMYYTLEEKQYDYTSKSLAPLRTSDGNAFLGQYYLQWKYLPTDNLHIIGGIFSQQLFTNQTFSIEPRLGIGWDLRGKQKLNFGYGLHSQSQPLQVYFTDTRIGEELVHTNRNLQFTKSHHLVAGYSVRIFDQINFKTEVYYQQIFGAPVNQNNKPTSFSLLNYGNNYEVSGEDSLVNNGEGKNYGAEFTLEKYFGKGYYFLVTASLYESKYMGSDKVWRNTAFNSNYVVNLLAGKEFKVAENKKIILDLKVVTAGGRRYTPVNDEASLAAGKLVKYDNLAFSEQFDPYFRTDIKVSYRVNRPKVTHEFFINIDNVFNTKNVFTYAYNFKTQELQYVYQLGIFPTFQYKIYF